MIIGQVISLKSNPKEFYKIQCIRNGRVYLYRPKSYTMKVVPVEEVQPIH